MLNEEKKNLLPKLIRIFILFKALIQEIIQSLNKY